jgi:predicted DNA-binding protein
MAPKKPKSFRMSDLDIERLEYLSKKWEMSKTMTLSQLLKQAVRSRNSLPKS